MSQPTENVRIALFGESDNGKSHYGAQLLSRIEVEKCELKLREASADLSVFDGVRKKLNEGLLAGHTPSGVYRDSIWPVIDGKGRSLDLTWPDYAGEQVKQLIDGRLMNQEWLDRTQIAHGWILIVRPKLAKIDDDIFNKPLANLGRSEAKPNDKKARRSIQARLVELLQMLLHARGMHHRDAPSPLTVLLSCWDELKLAEGHKPGDLMEERMPLLASYVRSVWGDRARILGLSALGTELSKTKANAEFVDNGPENHGFIVEADGTRNDDLTIPIVGIADMHRDR